MSNVTSSGSVRQRPYEVRIARNRETRLSQAGSLSGAVRRVQLVSSESRPGSGGERSTATRVDCVGSSVRARLASLVGGAASGH